MDLIDSNATPRTKRLYELLCRSFSHRIMLAQQESPSRMDHDAEMRFLSETTGHLPAIRGLDFIHNDFDGVVQRAKAWNDQGGIVSICWHTGVNGVGYPDSKEELPDFDRLLTPGAAEHTHLMERWREAAEALRKLQDADVPVLWRPFHEFDGQWFWWGKGGADCFIRLWRMMVDVFRDQYQLHNLIWILGYADDVLDGWYPGSDYCDIIGSDTYRGITTNAGSFDRLQKLAKDKPLAFHECGIFPGVDRFFDERAVWSWVMAWHSKWLMQDNTAQQLRNIYSDPRMVTLDRLEKF